MRPKGQHLRFQLLGPLPFTIGSGLCLIGSTALILDVLTGLVGNALDGSGARVALLLHGRLSLMRNTRDVLMCGRTDLINSRRSSALSLRDALISLGMGKIDLTPGGVN